MSVLTYNNYLKNTYPCKKKGELWISAMTCSETIRDIFTSRKIPAIRWPDPSPCGKPNDFMVDLEETWGLPHAIETSVENGELMLNC